MAIGDYRLSSETTRPVPQRGGGGAEGVMAIARSAAAHGLRPVERAHVPGGNAQFYAGIGRTIGEALAARDEREAADAALALQRELSERELAMYQKRGTDAGEYAAPDEETEYGRGFGNGVATQWSEAAVQRFDEVSAELSPGVRKRLAERMRPWMEAHRIGLLRHQMNEARSGERDRVMEGIGMRSATEAATAAARLAAIGRDGGQAPRTPGQGGATWDADVEAALAQVGVISETGALDDLDRATRRGVFTDEEARDIRRKNSANTIKALVGTLLESGSDSVAEAVIDRVSEGSEDEDGRETASIAAENGIGPEEIARWRGMVKAVRDRKEREAIGEITNISANALARGGLGDLEGALSEMNARAAKMPKGSRTETFALREAKRLDMAAQAEADRQTWDAIIEHAGDKKEWKPPEGRMAKNYRRLKESYDRQAAAYNAETMLAADAALKEERKSHEAALRTSMMAAAAVAPGAFAARLAEDASNGSITLGQYRRLRDEFNDVWMQKGMPEKAKTLVGILKDEFYQGADYDLSERLAVNPKTGRFEYAKDPETKNPFEGEDVEYEAQVLVPYDPNSWGGLKDFLGINRAAHYETETRTITSDEQLELLDIAMDLARYDGDEIRFDPVTKEPLDKPRAFDAADEFRRVCSRMKFMKGVEKARARIDGFAAMQGEVAAGFGRFEGGKVAEAERREAGEAKLRQAAKAAKRGPFAPRMSWGLRGAEAATQDGEAASQDEEE